jgi:hypothetical protein
LASFGNFSSLQGMIIPVIESPRGSQIDLGVMLVEPDLEQIEEVVAENISAQRTGTEPRSQIEASELSVRDDNGQNSCFEWRAVDEIEHEWIAG